MKTVEGIYDPAPKVAPTRIEDVAGCLAYRGPAKSLAEMHKAIEKGAKAHRP